MRHVLTLDYARKMAQQIIFNEMKGRALIGEQEDLAQHIMAAGVYRKKWYNKEARKNLRIHNLVTWAKTSQGDKFWRVMYMTRIIPPFVTE